MKKLIFALLMLLCVTGCGVMGPRVNAVPHSQAPVIEPGPNEAIVYIVRPWYSQGAARNIQVYEDGNPPRKK